MAKKKSVKKKNASSATSKEVTATKSSLSAAVKSLAQGVQTDPVKALSIALADAGWRDRTAKKIVAAGSQSPAYRYDTHTDSPNQIWLIAEFPPATPPLTFRALIDLTGAGSVVKYEDPYIRHV